MAKRGNYRVNVCGHVQVTCPTLEAAEQQAQLFVQGAEGYQEWRQYDRLRKIYPGDPVSIFQGRVAVASYRVADPNKGDHGWYPGRTDPYPADLEQARLNAEAERMATDPTPVRNPRMAVGPCDRTDDLARYLQVWEEARVIPANVGDTRSMLLELVEFGPDVAPRVWEENEEGGRYPGWQPGELIVRNRAQLALNRRERSGWEAPDWTAPRALPDYLR